MSERLDAAGRPARGRAGGRRRAGGRAAREQAPSAARRGSCSSARRARTSATTRRTPRCCWRRALGAPPREVAERLGEELEQRLGASLERFEVAGPGLPQPVPRRLLAASTRSREVLAAGEAFGAGGADRGRERILVEFVSANPTGPMHVGHARNAAYGDALGASARIPRPRGRARVLRQRRRLAGAQARRVDPRAGAGRGGPRGRLSRRLRRAARRELHGRVRRRSPAELGRAAVAVMVEQMQASLSAFRVRASTTGPTRARCTKAIRARWRTRWRSSSSEGHTYRSEGALWLRTTDYGDDKDRVLVRSNGEHTYFASDIAYHQDKRERGFDRQIDVWGADHHGYVARMKAAYAALGGDPEHLELLIMQLVHLMRGGERAQMSKRAGEFVTLDDLLTEIGVDAARWYLLARSHETTVDLDLDLAREQSSENPVYYVQYAHARIAAVLAKAGEERVREALAASRRSGSAERRSGRRMRERADGEGDAAARGRACADQAAARLSRGGRRGRRAARPAPDHGLCAAAGPGLHGLLPRLPRASAPSPRRSSRCGSRCRWRRSARSRAAWTCSGSARRRRCRRARAGASVPELVRSVSRTAPGRRPDGRRRRGERRASSTLAGLRAGVAAPAGQQHRERGEQRQERRERDEVDGQIEAVRARQREHRRAVLGDQRALDLRFGPGLRRSGPG